MELLPSDVARLVLGYLLDTCPDLAAQFLDQSPDLAEVRRTKRRAQRPFGLSLVELLTEHAVAFSLVDDAYSTMKPPGARTGNGDFLSKLRRLLSVITESKAESAGDALVHPAFPTPESSTGADSASQATTASQLTADGVSGAVDGDDPAVGGDWADTPTREAAAADTPAREAAAADCPDTAGQESPCNSLTLVLDEESGEEDMKDSEPGGGTGAVTQTHIASVKSTAEGDGQSVEKTRDCVGESSFSDGSGSGHDGSTMSTRAGRTRRKNRPTRRANPELSSDRNISQAVDWLYGHVRHLPTIAYISSGLDNGLSTQQLLKEPERLKSQPSGPEHRDTARSTNFDTARPSPPVKSESPASGVGPSIVRVMCSARPPTRTPRAPTATVDTHASTTNGSLLQTRRRLSGCKTTVVQPRDSRSRSPLRGSPASTSEPKLPTVQSERGLAASETATGKSSKSPAARRGTTRRPMRPSATIGGTRVATFSDSSCTEALVSLSECHESPRGEVAKSRHSTASGSDGSPCSSLADSTTSTVRWSDTSPAESTASTVRWSDSSPAGHRSDTSPTPPGSASSGPKSRPTDGADVAAPSPSQLSGRASEVSERTTPSSQRSLRIIPTPLTEGVKTPSLNGSLGDIETPTSARQGGRRGARSRGRSGPRRATAPRRRLMAEIQRRVESPRTPLEPSRPKAEPTPSTQSTAADRCKPGTAGDEVGDGSTRSGGVCRTARGAARRAGRPAVTSSDPVDQSAPDHTHQPGVKRPAVEGSPGQPVKTTPGNAKHLLKSLDIMSFLSRVHSIGSN
ncbi:mucin-12-like [Amphibalanus amphitrite]|uniref:mucin-12-like n=1 Tax=Amphibalanus amphitrite TaxID=1232801 RepID=UPI001C9168F5|nr:mucin-12-like [Amphibalanus amphitrite]